jgi:hypothetical protein
MGLDILVFIAIFIIASIFCALFTSSCAVVKILIQYRKEKLKNGKPKTKLDNIIEQCERFCAFAKKQPKLAVVIIVGIIGTIICLYLFLKWLIGLLIIPAILLFLFSDYIFPAKKTVDIRLYIDYLQGIVWDILYRYESRLPTEKPIVPDDLKRNIGVDTVVFTSIKKSTAALTKDDLREAETILRELVRMELYPANEYGYLIPNALTQNGININLESCEDKGLFFRMIFKITKSAKEADTSNECREVPPLRDDDLW